MGRAIAEKPAGAAFGSKLLSVMVLVLAGCGASSRPPGADGDIDGDADVDGDADADAPPGGEGEGEGEVVPGPREPDGVCTEAERNFDDDDGWAWHLETGDFVEDCFVCDTSCEGDIATFRSESGGGRDEPFHARVMVSNCAPSAIAQPVHVQLVRSVEQDGSEVVIGDGWTPTDWPPWAAVWVEIAIDHEQCGVSDQEGHWRLDADSTVTECDEQNNEPEASYLGC